MRVLARADASTQIGWGHVRRCLSLATALREQGHDTTFIWRDAGLDVAALVAAVGFPAHRLPPPRRARPPSTVPHAAWLDASPEEDADETAHLVRALHADVVLVDHYALASDWHRRVRSASGARIVVIDDLADRPLAPDLLLDPNPAVDHARKYRDVAEVPTHRILGGPAYALLDSVYAAHPKFAWRAEVRSIGIFMGGTDPGGFTEFALDAVRKGAGFEAKIEVVSTSANPALARLRERAAMDPGVVLTLDSPHLADFFARHDLQVGAGGGALWERCCIGAPTIALVCADNQLLSVPLLHEMGAVAGLDARPRGVAEALRLAEVVRKLIGDGPARRELSRVSMQLVDGLGAARVVAAMANLGEPA